MEDEHIIEGITSDEGKHVIAEDNKLALQPPRISVAFVGNLGTADKPA